jgi:hypothetical protein
MNDDLKELILSLVPKGGSAIGNHSLLAERPLAAGAAVAPVDICKRRLEAAHGTGRSPPSMTTVPERRGFLEGLINGLDAWTFANSIPRRLHRHGMLRRAEGLLVAAAAR